MFCQRYKRRCKKSTSFFTRIVCEILFKLFHSACPPPPPSILLYPHFQVTTLLLPHFFLQQIYLQMVLLNSKSIKTNIDFLLFFLFLNWNTKFISELNEITKYDYKQLYLMRMLMYPSRTIRMHSLYTRVKQGSFFSFIYISQPSSSPIMISELVLN